MGAGGTPHARPHLASPISRLHLAYSSPTSRLHLAHISPVSPQAAYPTLGVIWVDAHADANTPDTSPSMHYHGMPAAHLMGWFRRRLPGFDWFPNRTVLVENRLTLSLPLPLPLTLPLTLTRN